MHFDMSLSPCEMAQRLELEKVGAFDSLSDKYISFAALDKCNKDASRKC